MTNMKNVYNRRELEAVFGFSQAVSAGGFLFISGCLSWDMSGNPLHAGDMAGQVEAIYADIDATLKANGMTADNIVKETLYTCDMAALVAANDRRLAYYQNIAVPASTWVEVKSLVHPDLLLEIEVTAFLQP